MSYFIVERATPLLNRPDFRKIYGGASPFDEQNLVRAVEMIALPGMFLEVVQSRDEHILEVKSADYTASSLFVDQRFGSLQGSAPPPLRREAPSVELILERMKESLGLPYVWGGNYAAGIPEWRSYYPPQWELSPLEEAHWSFRGVDCSGLLYEAVDGCVPRNTNEQRLMGEEVSREELQPLDLIFSPGHVCILLSEDEVIESCLELGGVVIRSLDQRLKELDSSTFRRFHHHLASSQRS